MKAIELVDTLHQQGFTLTPLPDGKLAVKPADRITDELRQHIRQCKAEVVALLTRPHLNGRDELLIPFNSDPKYHWWKPGGQSIAQTLTELNAPAEVWRRYIGSYTETRQ
jgi:hypothetical protein